MTTLEEIAQQIKDNPIILYMKGTPAHPQCGFSARAVQMLEACNADFASIDVLERLDIRQTLPQYAQWPTFPQLYINGTLVGGCDIMTELFQTGELQNLIGECS